MILILRRISVALTRGVTPCTLFFTLKNIQNVFGLYGTVATGLIFEVTTLISFVATGS